MNFQFYIEQLHESDEFKQFIKENPKAYFCSAFFMVDMIDEDNKIHLDYAIKSKKNVLFSFEVEHGCKKVKVETYDNKIPEKLSEDIDFNINDIKKLVSERIEKDKIKNTMQKIILSLQRLNGRDFLVGTVFLSMLGMLKVNIDIEKMEITLFEKKSLFDMMKVIKKKKPEDYGKKD